MLPLLLQPRGSLTPLRLANDIANAIMAEVGGRPVPWSEGVTRGSRFTAEEPEIAAIRSLRRARVRCRNRSARRTASARVVARPISASSASNTARPTGSP